MQIFKKIIFASVLAWLIFLPAAGVRAADVLAPELNPVCWEQKACEKARKAIAGDAAKATEGWMEKQDPCNKKDWGMCLPAGKTVTEVSFGGNKNFANIGEFILTIYKYAVGVASILATVMIIISGTQWATSGGNTETISSAKKRIAGAVIGLFIALMSNFILSSINPALVNLRLPQTYMLRPQVLASEYCADMDTSTTQFALAAKKGEKVDATQYAKKTQWTLLKATTEQDQDCGNQWFVKNGNGVTCVSSFCKSPGGGPVQCAIIDPTKKQYDCQEGMVIGRVINTPGISNAVVENGCVKGAISGSSGWKWPWIKRDSDAQDGLYVVCAQGAPVKVTDQGTFTINDGDPAKQTQSYIINLSLSIFETSANSKCNGLGGIKGFGVVFRFNHSCWMWSDQYHLLGRGGVAIAHYKGLATVANPDASNLFSLDELKKGVRLDIDASAIEVK